MMNGSFDMNISPNSYFKITDRIHFPPPIILDRRYLWNGQGFLYGIHKTLLRQVSK